MSSLRNSIKKADPAPEKKEEIMLNLNLLFELATSKCDHFKTQIADNIRTLPFRLPISLPTPRK